MEQFSFNTYTLHYRVFGSGSPVLFLHGFLEDHIMWLPIATELSNENCTVYLFDLPCHGESRFDGETCAMEGVASVLAAFIKTFKLNNPLVFGHSMGGYIGLELLRQTPIQLTLIHSNFWADSPSKKADRNRVIEIVKSTKMRLIQEAIPHLFAVQNRVRCKQAIENLVTRAATIPAAEIIACTRGMRDRADSSALIKNHHIEIIQGDEDPIISTSKLLSALEKVSDHTTVHYIKACGHMSVWEDPNALINLIRRIVFR